MTSKSPSPRSPAPSSPSSPARARHASAPPPAFPKARFILIGACLLLAWFGLAGRVAYLHLGPNVHLHARVNALRDFTDDVSARRGRILDRNGQLLALDVPVTRIDANPSLLASNNAVGRMAYGLAQALDRPLNEVLRSLDHTNRLGVTVMHYATTDLVQRVQAMTNRLALDGLAFHPESVRSYPGGSLACHVVGFANREGIGSAGVEQQYDSYLRPHSGLLGGLKDGSRREIRTRRTIEVEQLDGADVTLTLDQNVQYFAESALAAAITNYDAEGGWVIVEEVKTGAILAMASWPPYDPNAYSEASPHERLNQAIGATYEPGSIFKVGVVAAALDAGLVATNDLFDCENGLWMHNGRALHDFHPYGILDVTGIIAKSSNVGAAKIAVLLGEPRLYKYLTSYGFGRRAAVGLPGEEGGILYADWRKHGIDITRIAMGHSVAITALQMVTFLCCIGNDGYLMHPYLLKSVTTPDGQVLLSGAPETIGRPLTERTARQMRNMLTAVTGPEGTAKKANIPGYVVGGKTGTAEKLEHGHYVKSKNMASFMGLVPADNPVVGIIVTLDAPRRNRTAGQCAAPFFASVAAPVAHYLDIPTSDASDTVAYNRILALPDAPEDALDASLDAPPLPD